MFDWDDANREHVRRHAVEPDECEEAIRDGRRILWPVDQERGEERLGIIGQIRVERALAVVFTLRSDRIRVVTAWPATNRQRRAYEEANR